MLQKGCDCRKGEVEEWKQNWDEDFMDKVRGEREKEKGVGRERK
jgi:hypothetical protein